MPRSDRHPGGAGGVLAQSRRDDRSGLIDIRALSSLVDAQRRGGPSASASSVALPSFTTPWTMQDTRVPEPAAPPAAKPAAASPDNRPLYVMIASLTLAVASLGAYVVLRPAPTVAAETTTVAAAPVLEPPEAEATPAVAGAEDEAEPEDEAAPEDEAEPEAEAAPEDEAEPATAKARPKRPRPHRKPKPERTADPEPKPKKERVVSVECVLDPSKCGSSKGLPATPSAAQIRDAMSTVKPEAKACAGRHGGRAGDKVKVKLSAKGSTGAITSARALDDHAGTPLGRCVASALSKAKLPRFSKKQAGIVYSVRM